MRFKAIMFSVWNPKKSGLFFLDVRELRQESFTISLKRHHDAQMTSQIRLVQVELGFMRNISSQDGFYRVMLTRSTAIRPVQ